MKSKQSPIVPDDKCQASIISVGGDMLLFRNGKTYRSYGA